MPMKVFRVALLCAAAQVASASAVGTRDPIAKIVTLITDLQGKLVRDGEAEEKAYKDFFEWCDDASTDAQFAIKTGTAKKEKLDAIISEAASDMDEASTRVEELSGTIAANEADLKAATTIRKKENADFSAEEKELMVSIDMLGRAIGVLEKELGSSSLLQAKVNAADLSNILSGLSVVIDAASFSSHDKERLVSLLQSQQDAEDDGELGVQKEKSASIVDVLGDMKDKAEAQLAEGRKAEMTAKFNYAMLKQSLEDGLSADNHEMEETKANKAEAQESSAVASGELEVTLKALAEATNTLHITQMDCMEKATNHEISAKGRAEELKALAVAKKIIQAMTFAQTSSSSFIQTASSTKGQSRFQSRAQQTGIEVVNLVKKLARSQHSASLSQLASRMAAVIRYGGRSGEDPFVKVKGLINEMIEKLLKEAEAEAGEKAYCDAEMAKTTAKKDELTDDIEALTAKIDQAASGSVRLKEEVKSLQSALAEMAKLQSEMDTARAETNGAFMASAADLQKGLDGIRLALKTLRDYYAKEEAAGAAMLQTDESSDDDSQFDAMMQQPAAPQKHEKSSGAGGSIISMLEVAEADFAKNLAEENAEESAAQEEYDKVTQDNTMTKTTSDQDVKYKTKEFKALDKAITEYSGDRDGMQTELDAVMEYDVKIKEKCIAKPPSYEELKKRRDAEIAGLKEALSILEGQAVFLQRHRQ